MITAREGCLECLQTRSDGRPEQRYRQVAIMHRKGRIAAVVKGEVPPRRHGDGRCARGSITKSKFRMAGGRDADNGRYMILTGAVMQCLYKPVDFRSLFIRQVNVLCISFAK